MRIAVLATTRNPLVEPFAGGQESVTATLVRRLRVRGHEVRLYGRPGTDPALADETVPYEPLPTFSPTALADPQLPEPDFLTDQQAMLGALADVGRRRDVDVIHNQSLHHLPLAMARMLPAPVVTTLHTPPFPWLEMGASLGGSTSHLVAVSHALARRWSTLDPAPRVIHNGVDDTRFALGPGGSDLVWVGRLIPDKGADVAARAAARAGLGLRLAGPVADRGWFEARVAPLLGEAIRYEGHLTAPEVAELVGRSRALLMTPRWDEPFGLTAVEAALTGTPVVAIGRGAMSEVVDARTGVVVPDATEDVLVERLAAAVPDAAALPRRGVRESARERFSLDRMAAAYEALFAGLVAGRRVA